MNAQEKLLERLSRLSDVLEDSGEPSMKRDVDDAIAEIQRLEKERKRLNAVADLLVKQGQPI